MMKKLRPAIRKRPSQDFTWHPLHKAVDAFVSQVDGQDWSGSPTDLYERLTAAAPADVRALNLWPATAAAMSSQLERMAVSLRRRGLVVSRARSDATRVIRVARVTSEGRACASLSST